MIVYVLFLWRKPSIRKIIGGFIVVKKFGEGAFNAKRAGFDGVEIHAVHEGYLMKLRRFVEKISKLLLDTHQRVL